ncbi:hypothetical protein ISU02_15235 [Fusibacter sp. Q10-2]|uniref:DUF1858 domain-containing protein n=1 Tax=Fusibacter ferrireducens TaxID=2785058 RepID=A0ABR9ZVK5_9FIRM|nr:hypothetical protein [Fusibacter ferrireducens]
MFIKIQIRISEPPVFKAVFFMSKRHEVKGLKCMGCHSGLSQKAILKDAPKGRS